MASAVRFWSGATARNRLLIIAAAFVWMIVIGRDFRQRIELDQNFAAAEAEDRDTPSEAELRGELIDGPAVIGLYFQQGYAWAAAHGVTVATKCPADNRAYRDGCRAYVAHASLPFLRP